jgi:subtilisin family serine protease
MVTTCDISNDPYYTSGRQWNMEGPQSLTGINGSDMGNPNGINAQAAWSQGATGSSSVVVGIVDTGIQITHPELADNIWTNPFDLPDGIDNDGNGYVDDIHGWDFLNNDNSVYDGLMDGHGTHVAGTIGAKGGNGVGVAGVNWNVSMISAKFMSSTGGTTADAIRAIDYLTDMKVRHGINLVAINASWGSGEYSQALQDAVLRSAKSDILIVAAAGNSRSNNDLTPFYPASFSTLNGTPNEAAATYDSVISVTAISNDGGLAYYSNIGPESVDIAAPGTGIISTIPNKSYAVYSGTSMATPHVTGAIALYAAQHPGTSASDIRSAILGSVQTSTYLDGRIGTSGRLDVSAALAVNPPAAPDLAQISVSDVTLVEGDQGTTFAEFTIGMNKVLTTPVTLDYSTSDASALAGEDYVATSGTVTIEAGSSSVTVRVPVIGDTKVEQDETFALSLSNVVGQAVLTRSQALAKVTNDDVYIPQTPTIQVADSSIAEGNRGWSWMTFDIARTGDLSGYSSVFYVTTSVTARAFSDFMPTAGVLRFNPGESSKSVRVQINGDRNAESDESFRLVLSGQLNAILDGNFAIGTILDDDTPGRSNAASLLTSGSTFSGTTPIISSTPIFVPVPNVTKIAQRRIPLTAFPRFLTPPRSLPIMRPRPGGPPRPANPVRPI